MTLLCVCTDRLGIRRVLGRATNTNLAFILVWGYTDKSAVRVWGLGGSVSCACVYVCMYVCVCVCVCVCVYVCVSFSLCL